MQPGQELAAASSPDWFIRARAGQRLAQHAESLDVAELLMLLLLDEHDTAVTDATSETLLQRDDVHGIRLLALAVTRGDDQHIDHLYTTIQGHLQTDDAVVRFIDLCCVLTGEANPEIRAGTERLLQWVRPWARAE